MSMPTIPDINPEINIVRDDAINIIIASIAMEELALAHILNAEGEKLQYVLGTLEGRDPGEVTICDIMAVNDSIHKTLRDVIKEEMLLQLKLEDAIELAENAGECQLNIRGQKIWRDGNNVADTRPATVEITLLRDGEVFRTVTVDGMGDGAYTFACLPVWRDSENRYTYTVDEADVSGYTKTVSGYNIINTVEPGEITIAGSIIWVDDNNVRQERPEQVTVNLLQNGVQFRTTTVARPEDTVDTVPFNFADVPQFDGEGNLFVYTVTQDGIITNYTTVINGFNITNTIEQVFITVDGSKIWDDAADVGQRPADAITVNLLQNGEQFASMQVAIPPDDVFTVPISFANVPRYDDQNVEFVYTVEEADVIAGYTTSVAGNDITNTLIP